MSKNIRNHSSAAHAPESKSRKRHNVLRKRKPKRQGSRSQTGKHLPQRRPMPFQTVNRSWQQQNLCRRKGEFTWHMCLFPRT